MNNPHANPFHMIEGDPSRVRRGEETNYNTPTTVRFWGEQAIDSTFSSKSSGTKLLAEVLTNVLPTMQ